MNTFDIPIVFEHEEFVVVNKPAGMLVHPAHADGTAAQEPVLSAWVQERYPEASSIVDPVSREQKYGIVHRLDKETSGVMVVAKNQRAFETLKRLFQTHQVTKIYHALLVGELPQREGTIALPIAKSKQGTKRTTRVRPDQRAREALTAYRTLRTYQDDTFVPGQILSYTELIPKTGRTHQLRVHCATLGCPVTGDYLYGGKRAAAYRAPLGRMFLHARTLAFSFAGSSLRFEADLPRELELFLQKLRVRT